MVWFCLVVRPSALLFSTQQTRPPGCRPDVHFSKRLSPPVCKARCPFVWAVTGPKFLGRLHLPAPTPSRQLQGLMSLSSWDVHPLSRVLPIMPLPSALPAWHLGAWTRPPSRRCQSQSQETFLTPGPLPPSLRSPTCSFCAPSSEPCFGDSESRLESDPPS